MSLNRVLVVKAEIQVEFEVQVTDVEGKKEKIQMQVEMTNNIASAVDLKRNELFSGRALR